MTMQTCRYCFQPHQIGYRCREYDNYIALRREEALAALTIRQRIARHWAWFWQMWVLVGLLLVAIALGAAWLL